MKTQQMLDSVQSSDAISWIKGELDSLLDQTREELVSHIEEDQDPAQLDRINKVLTQISNTFNILEVHGAILLADEMRNLVTALKDNLVNSKDNAYEVLLRAILLFPDYLEQVRLIGKEIPLVLLPLLNDLRTLRNAELLSGKILFFPDLHRAEVPAPKRYFNIPAGQTAQELAKRLRHPFQLGLLGWFQGVDTRSHLLKMQKVCMALYQLSKTNQSRRLWWISSAFIEGLSTNGIESSVTAKSIIGSVDRQLKSLVDHGDTAFINKIPDELIVNLLYYISLSSNTGEIAKDIKRAYALSELVPNETKLESLRERISSPNKKIMQTVANAVREDIAEVKDSLDIFISSNIKDLGLLEKTIVKLHQIADTLFMIGLNDTSKSVLDEIVKVRAILDGKEDISDNVIMNVASVLLNIDLSIDSYTHSCDAYAQEIENNLENIPFDHEKTFVEAGYRRHLDSITEEAIKEIEKIKDVLLAHIASPQDTIPLSQAPQYLDNVTGALTITDMYGAQVIREVLGAIRAYISYGMPAGKETQNSDLETLADAITSVEYYLKALGNREKSILAFIEAGKVSAAKLRLIIQNRVSEPILFEKLEHQDEEFDAVKQATSASTEILSPKSDSTKPEDTVKKRERNKLPLDQHPNKVNLDSAVSVEDESKKVTREYQTLPVLTGEIDQDILEIFLEEAEEEFNNVKELFPEWRRHTDDFEALLSIRRSFHTLKGSGRLVGAKLLGEFAWAYENLLNRILDHKVPASHDIINELSKAIDTLPSLIDQIHGKETQDMDPYTLMDKAHTLSKRPFQDDQQVGNIQ